MVLSKIKLIGIADVLTLSNATCGLLAIVAFIWFYPNITYGTGLIFLGLVFDGMDGAAARKFGTKHDFGRHLDSIADAFTFVLAPSVLVFVVFTIDIINESTISLTAFMDPRNAFTLLTSIFVVFFGLKRLIDFTQHGYKLKSFLGLATPALGFYVIVISHILDPHRPENDSMVSIYFCLITIFIGSLLLRAPVKYPKIRGKLGVVLAIAIILSLLSIEVQRWLGYSSYDDLFIYYRIMSFCGLGIVISYIFISPIILISSKNDKNKGTSEK
jgi:CDP-diacylglycerol--serine O-phosphatidyltransferase